MTSEAKRKQCEGVADHEIGSQICNQCARHLTTARELVSRSAGGIPLRLVVDFRTFEAVTGPS